MVGSALISLPPHRFGIVAKSWPRGTSLRVLATDALWILFLAGASGVGYGIFGLGTLERYVWLSADAAMLVCLLIWRDQFLVLARKSKVIMTWPLLACASAVWSLTPFLSAYYGLQLLLTVLVGFLLCVYASFQRILQLVFVALLCTAVLAPFIPGKAFNVAGQWLGAFSHKNLLGHTMAILILAGICLFLQGWRPIFASSGLLFAACLLYLSDSGAAFVTLAVTLPVLPLILVYRKGTILVALAAGLAILLVAVVLLFAEAQSVNLIEAALDALGKDATLTGRTLLWDFGLDAFNTRPMLGFGYKGYWSSNDTSAYLLRFVIGQELWSFHNNFVEVAVAFGFIGPILFTAGLLWAFFVTFKRAIAATDYVSLWPLLFVVYVLVLSFVELPLFENHSLHQLLFTVSVAGSMTKGVSER